MSQSSKESTIIGPLNFNLPQSKSFKIAEKQQVNCLLCDINYTFDDEKDQYLAHLYLVHRLVIGEIHQITMLPEYLEYWRSRFVASQFCLEDFCTVLLMNQLPDGTPSKNEKYYLLSNDLPEDFQLRKNLHLKRLENVLAQHQFERTDQTFERGCLYCRDVISPTRAAFIEHLFKKHFLQLGKAENLIFIDDLIDCVQEKLNQLICLYCEKIFKDRPTLKEHMRKKGHKRINPENRNYDKYFLINYKNELAAPKAATVFENLRESTPRVFQTDNSDSDWSDWDGEQQPLICLFCSEKNVEFKNFKKHMKTAHTVDFDSCVSGLTFYQKVKVINYVRRQMHTLKCVTCFESFENLSSLHNHLNENGHYGIGSKKCWDQPEYFFSTYEDDAVLCHLEDENYLDDDASVVIMEERKIEINPDAELLSKETLLSF